MKKTGKRAFTLIEIMLAVSIIGLLASIGIPAVLNAYTKAQASAMDRNIVEVEKAKGVLTLPRGLMPGAMSLTANHDFDDEVVSNLCAALRINEISELDVGDSSLQVGTLTLRAYYEE